MYSLPQGIALQPQPFVYYSGYYSPALYFSSQQPYVNLATGMPWLVPTLPAAGFSAPDFAHAPPMISRSGATIASSDVALDTNGVEMMSQRSSEMLGAVPGLTQNAQAVTMTLDESQRIVRQNLKSDERESSMLASSSLNVFDASKNLQRALSVPDHTTSALPHAQRAIAENVIQSPSCDTLNGSEGASSYANSPLHGWECKTPDTQLPPLEEQVQFTVQRSARDETTSRFLAGN
jgi:hypothetical protein